MHHRLFALPAVIGLLAASWACPAMGQPPRTAPRATAVAVKALPVARAKRPDPRFRPASGFSELRTIAGEVAKATGRTIRWQAQPGPNPGPLARIRGGVDNCTIHLHPIGARKVPPNTWAFIFGHEFAHRVDNLGNHDQAHPENELKADIAGARYAMAAGYHLDAFLGWMLTEPDKQTASHGSLHRRAYAVAAHFRIPKRVIEAQAQRYREYRRIH